MRNTSVLGIEDTVMLGLNCLEQGLENKATIRENILEAISQSYTSPEAIEEIPVDIFSLLHEKFGLGLVIRGGQIIGYAVENTQNYVDAVWRSVEFNGMVSLICAHKGGCH